jgi:transmembrane sensor
MDRNLYLFLAEKYVQGTATPEERELVEAWYAELGKDHFNINVEEREAARQEVMAELEKAITVAKPVDEPATIVSMQDRVRPRKWFGRVAAAIVLLVLSGGAWVYFNSNTKQVSVVDNRYTGTDVLPGSYKAKLTLKDGKTIILDSAAAGELARQGSARVLNQNGQLVYEFSAAVEGAVAYNTVSTAKGETYSMRLADGSVIILNAGSSVHFPVAFPGKERRIEITGEVYVRVAKDKSKPFIASVNGMDVLALGTEFNINSYGDESHISTTLIEGSVKVTRHNAQIILQPGEQAIQQGPGLVKHTAVDMEKILAWKNGEFIFDRDELPVIMKQLERWYDVEVVYEGALPKRTFSGSISRSRNASAVLKMLQRTGLINMKIEGKKIIVTP